MSLGEKIVPVLVGTGSFLLSLILPKTELTPIYSTLQAAPNPGALTNTLPQYVPPRGTRRRAQRTQGGGSRGCDQAIPVNLNLLAPNDHDAATVSGHPTFLWHVSDQVSVPIRFSLAEPGTAKPIWDQYLKLDRAGVVRFQLPNEAPELKEGKEYIWTVAIVCNPLRQSDNIYARSWIQYLSKPDLIQKLKLANNPGERIKIYAQSGVWYDAISSSYALYIVNPDYGVGANYFFTLLNQIGLSEVATQEQQELAEQIKRNQSNAVLRNNLEIKIKN